MTKRSMVLGLLMALTGCHAAKVTGRFTFHVLLAPCRDEDICNGGGGIDVLSAQDAEAQELGTSQVYAASLGIDPTACDPTDADGDPDDDDCPNNPTSPGTSGTTPP